MFCAKIEEWMNYFQDKYGPKGWLVGKLKASGTRGGIIKLWDKGHWS